MDAVAAGRRGNLEQGLGVQVRADRIRGGAVGDLAGLVGKPGVQGKGVHRRVHANRVHAKPRGCLRDANRDLAPVAYQNAFVRLV